MTDIRFSIFIFFCLLLSVQSWPWPESSRITRNTDNGACHDFYEYVCSNRNQKEQPRISPKKKSSFKSTPIQWSYDVTNQTGTKNLYDVVESLTIAKWIVEFKTLKDGLLWPNFMEEFNKTKTLDRSQQIEIIEKDLLNMNTKDVDVYFDALSEVIETSRLLRLPISRKNPFYHSLYQSIQDIIVETIQEQSLYEQELKNELIEQFLSSKVLFAYFDYNNRTVWENAKKAYEMEYGRLKSLLIESQIDLPNTEKVIRIGAIEASISVLHKYIDEFTERFVFQSVIAHPTRDCFNYFKEILMTVVTRVDPSESEAVFEDTLFVVIHELMHSIYNILPQAFEKYKWEKEKQCLLKTMKTLADSSSKKVEIEANLLHEDVANMEAIRILMRIAAKKSHSELKMRETLEKVIGRFCFSKTDSMHNSNAITMNTAAAELPVFKKLYDCKQNDRMYIEKEEVCESMAIPQREEDYTVRQLSEYDLENLAEYLNRIENAATDVDEMTSGNVTDINQETMTEPVDNELPPLPKESDGEDDGEVQDPSQAEIDEVGPADAELLTGYKEPTNSPPESESQIMEAATVSGVSHFFDASALVVISLSFLFKLFLI